ncbi:MAG TPA: hypothetical protein VEA63_04150, partial [Opitutus sp.]|nr:hypothetical protein [Opitutus sp.]
TDPSIFDFYNKLLDGDNKREWADWDAYQANVSQTFLGNSVGYELAYFKQTMDRGQWGILGWDNFIAMDINATTSENTPNPDVGRAYIQAENRDIGNYSLHSEREAKRATLFGEYDFQKRHSDNLWTRILGTHRINGVASEEGVKSDRRGFRLGDLDNASKLALAPRGGIEGDQGITSAFRYYLSDDLRGQPSAANSNISNISQPAFVREGGLINVRYWDNTWIAGPEVDPGAEWTNPFGDVTFQSENPANYRGWAQRDARFITIMSKDRQLDMSAKDYLTSSGSLSDFKVKSLVGVWQAYLWDKSIIGTYGYREDRFRRFSYTSSDRQGTGRADTGGADLRPTSYNYANPDGTIENMRTIT